jgi:hypothetical protein
MWGEKWRIQVVSSGDEIFTICPMSVLFFGSNSWTDYSWTCWNLSELSGIQLPESLVSTTSKSIEICLRHREFVFLKRISGAMRTLANFQRFSRIIWKNKYNGTLMAKFTEGIEAKVSRESERSLGKLLTSSKEAHCWDDWIYQLIIRTIKNLKLICFNLYKNNIFKSLS